MKNLGIGTSVDLQPTDVAQYAGDSAAADLALVISEEVEQERKRQRATSTPVVMAGEPQGVLDAPAEKTLYAADLQPWYEVLTNSSAIDACSDRLQLSRTDFLGLVISKLLPPNWQTFFWMKAYLEAVPAELHAAMLAQAAEVERSKLANKRSQQSRDAGKESGRARQDRASERVAEIKEAWATLERRGVDKRDRAGIVAKKCNVTPDYVRRLMRGGKS